MTEAIPSPAVAERATFADRVSAVARHLQAMRGKTGARGQLAILRRMGVGERRIPPEAYWDVVRECSLPESEDDLWSQLLPWMAAHPHQRGAGPGRVFFEAGITAPRLERWLRANHETALRDAPRVLARLGDAAIDWTRLAPLLRDWTLDQRRDLAREYFRSAHRAQTRKGE